MPFPGEDRIESIVEEIIDIARFEYYYLTNSCFRTACNNLYDDIQLQKYNQSDEEGVSIFGIELGGKEKYKRRADAVEPNSVRPKVPIVVHNNRLSAAQDALRSCLYRNQTTEDQTENVAFPDAEIDVPDPNRPIISPFDRRLDRLLIDTVNGNGVQGITPMSTKHAQAGTIGYTVSESYVRNSEVADKQKIIDKIQRDISKMQKDDYFVGVPALNNNYAIVKLYGSKGGQHLMNQKGKRKWYEIDETIGGNNPKAFSLNPTTSSIIDWGNGDPYGRTPYHFTDFVFSKHWRKVPNNRLITLRRFAAPIVDNMKFPGMDGTNDSGSANSNIETNTNENGGDNFTQNGTTEGGIGKKVSFPPMASAVTYFGEETQNTLSDILKFSTGMPWDDIESDVWSVQPEGGPPDSQSGPSNLWPGLTRFAKTLNIATGNWDPDAVLNKGNLPPDPYENGPYENRIIGPVNRITKVKKRKAGIDFEMSGLNLVFEYIARPVGGVNPKAALLDIIGNFLVIGSTSAMFWGGQHRFMGNPIQYPFLGGDKGIQQWYSGKPLAWGATTIKELIGKTQNGAQNVIEQAKSFFNNLLNGGGNGDNSLFGSLGDIFTGEGAGGNLIKAFAAEKSSGQIPYLSGLKALLIGEPVGEWHVTIGNPLNPIAMIGNLICTGMEFEFGNELGPDDFPTEIKITVKLDHGMARDRDAIQSIFNRGMGRYYDLPDSFRGSAEDETRIDNQTGGDVPRTGRNPVYYRVPIADSTTTGGKFGRSAVRDNTLEGSVSVWNRSKFTAVSPNSNFAVEDPEPIFRSSFRSADWVGLKSLR